MQDSLLGDYWRRPSRGNCYCNLIQRRRLQRRRGEMKKGSREVELGRFSDATQCRLGQCRVGLLADHGIVVDADLNSINAMTPDPNTLMPVKASDCTSDALPNNQALQRNSMRDESATLTAQATAIPPCFNTLIGSHLHRRKPGAHRQASSP